MVTCTGHIGIHEGADGRTDVYDVMAIKPNFLTSMGYHIFLTMVLRARSSATILAVMISCVTAANSSAKRLNTQAGILSAPVAFLAFSCFKTFLTCPMLGRRGLETERPSG